MTGRWQQRRWRWLAVLAMPALSSCLQQPALESPEQLRRWIVQIKQQDNTRFPPTLAETRTFRAMPYPHDSDITPFGENQKNTLDGQTETMAQRPPQRGARQAMEDVPLASIRLVGTLARGSDRYALVQVAGQLHRISMGDYVGTKFGMVLHISESTLTLQELTPDATGSWTESLTQLAMEGSHQ